MKYKNYLYSFFKFIDNFLRKDFNIFFIMNFINTFTDKSRELRVHLGIIFKSIFGPFSKMKNSFLLIIF